MRTERNSISDFIINPLSSFHILLFLSLISYFIRIVYKPEPTIVQHVILLITTISFWLGTLTSIYLVESWTKFIVPSVEIRIGMDVLRHVFSVLNKFEIAISIVLLNLLEMQWTDASLQLPYSKSTLETLNISLLTAVTIVGFLETCWLLPSLLHKTQLFVQSNSPGLDFYSVVSSFIFYFYSAAEVVKISCLLFAWKVLVLALMEYVDIIAKE